MATVGAVVAPAVVACFLAAVLVLLNLFIDSDASVDLEVFGGASTATLLGASNSAATFIVGDNFIGHSFRDSVK